MKFIAALALLTAAGVSAEDTSCEAEYIVTRCLGTETPKIKACASTDYDCLCAAYQAVATCYNNCPNDSRAPAAKDEVTTFCRNASMYGTKTQTPTSAGAAATSEPTTTLMNLGDSNSKPSNTAAGGSNDDGGFQAGPTPTDSAAAAGVPNGAGSAAFAAGLVGLVMAML